MAYSARNHRKHQFQIADWLLEGISLNSAAATYDIAETLFPQYARATFASWVTVAKHFPASIRIEGEFLTFKHYQVVQGCTGTSEEEKYKKLFLAQELVWLRKADESKMSVSLLREAINTCWVTKRAIANANKAAEEGFADAHKKWEDAEPKKSDNLPKWVNEQSKEHELPKWLGDKRLKWSIEELAKARDIAPHELVMRAVAEFIDAHSNELGDIKAAKDKREEEQRAEAAAAAAVDIEKRNICAEFADEKASEKAARELALAQEEQRIRLARKQHYRHRCPKRSPTTSRASRPSL